MRRGRFLPPGEMFPAGDSRYRVAFVTLPDGLRVRIVECGDAVAPPVLFVHGWGCYAYEFRENLPAIAETGYRAICPDLKGHGLSDKPRKPSDYSTESMTEHVRAIADVLGLKRFALVGHSMGAGFAIRVAIRDDRVVALGLLSPVGFAGLPLHWLFRLATPRIATPLIKRFASRFLFRVFLRIAYGKIGRPSEDEIDQYYAVAQFPGFTEAMRNLLHEADWGPIPPEILGRLTIPTSVVAGSFDHLYRSQARQFLEHTLPHARVRVVPEAGHVVTSEVPAIVNSEILDLLQRSGLRADYNS